MSTITTAAEKTRRLSKSRVTVAIAVVAAVAAGGVYLGTTAASNVSAATASPWFAGYADVTNTPSFAFEAPTTPTGKNVVLSFVVADSANDCAPSWGAAYTLEEASTQLDLDRRIARLEQGGGEAIVSFGGEANSELAVACTNQTDLVSAYSAVIDRYSLTTIDLDLEGNALDASATARRAEAVATLQAKARAADSELAVWLTLPVTPKGLGSSGTDAVAAFLKAGVDIAGVNAMTMDFGATKPAADPLLTAVEASLTATHRQLGILYSTAGISLSSGTLWSKLGATPMIGQNDTAGEVFTLSDAARLNTWVEGKGLGRVSMWSLNRDATCGSSYTDLNRVSTVCSGVDQGEATFADALGADMIGTPEANATTTTTPEPVSAQEPDDPATSPYGIWDEDATYLATTKVTWHHNVYQAKWWTKGDLPDDAVLDADQTPWTLIGPVLPGETPIPIPTLPAGSYPEWNGTAVYEKGDRVLFDGIPFESKWWTQGDSPEASSNDADSSPWTPLSAKQIKEILDGTIN